MKDNVKTGPWARARLIQSSRDFVAGFTPPDYLISGILQRGFCYALTGKTNAGKTAMLLSIAALVALGRPLNDRDVARGRVLFLSGENSIDVRMRWIAMSQQMDFDIDSIDVHFTEAFKISEMWQNIYDDIAAIDDVSLVAVDTSAAFFEGDDENDNKQAGNHARLLRSLTKLPGGPCVLVACHPAKNASDDNLEPRGGGALIAEIDGNLTAKSGDGTVSLHWQKKFRGPDFAPIPFQLRTVTNERLKDTKGRLLPTVVASSISEAAQEEIAKAVQANEYELLNLLPNHPNASLAELARLLDWKMRDGKPYKVMVSRALEALIKQKLVTKDFDTYSLTTKAGKLINKTNDRQKWKTI